MTAIQINIPNWLDRICSWPVLEYRRRKYGHPFRRISLGEGRFTILDQQDFYRLGNFNWFAERRGECFYAVRHLISPDEPTKIIRMHRVIMNAPKGLLVDHKNNDGLDNRRENLRLATSSQNNCNKRKRKNASSRFVGVSFNKLKRRWCAYICFNGKNIWLGWFDSEIEAAKAYDEAARKYHGEFAKLNFPEENHNPEIRNTKYERRTCRAFTFTRKSFIILAVGLVCMVSLSRLRSERVVAGAGNLTRWKMPIVTFYFQLHQPFRLHPDRDIFLWDDKNREIFEKVSQKCYLPATKMFTRLISDYPEFKIAFSMSGTFLEQAQNYKPEVITCLQKLLDAGKKRNQVEFLEETYYHSLSGLFADPNRQEFRDQVALHRAKMEEIFGIKPCSFRNTELMFNNEIADVVTDMGFAAMLCEKRNDMFGLKKGIPISPNAVFKAKTSNLVVIPRNRELSDDIAFRFPHTPISAEHYAWSIAQIDGEAVLLGYDYEHIGEHIWKDKGIFEFWKDLPAALADKPSVKMANPSEVAQLFKNADCPIVDIHGLSTSSWADTARDTFGWLGNKTQQELFARIQNLEPKARQEGRDLLTKWRHLTTSDHLYFLHQGSGSDQAVHSYFSPYGSIGETVRIITDKIWTLEKSVDTFQILKKTERTPVIIISPETDRLPTEGMGDFAKYVSGKSGGMGEVVAALCRGLSSREIPTYIITLNLERKFLEKSAMPRDEYIQKLYHLPRDKIRTVDSPLFENYLSAYDGDPRATAAEFQRTIKRSLIGEILSKHQGRGIIHSNDWMSGGIITAFCRMMRIPVLHSVHNTHTGYIPLKMFFGVNLGELWSNLFLSNDLGRQCLDCQATAIKNANLVSYVGTRFLEETVQDYFLDRHFIPASVRQETKAKYQFGSVLAIPNGISPSVYPENQDENPDIDKPGLAKRFGLADNVIEAKKLNLVKFQKKTGLIVNPEAILLYWPSRLDRMQKGVELIEDIALRFVADHPDTQIAIVGNPVGNDRRDVDILGKIAWMSGGKITYWPFDDDLSILGYAAASDVFGASLYEPFGQIDLIGNLYGATATNRDTGGFHDKIMPLRLKKLGAPEDIGNGVLFRDYDSSGLWQGLHSAVENHRFFRSRPDEWERQAKRIMKEARDKWGLDNMIAGYLAAYQRILGYPLI
ncbi:MAG: AP2 domain-containing protein [Planctomycetota bacterium]